MSGSFCSLSVPTRAADHLLARRSEFQHALLEWFRLHQRKLPWREDPSLYKTVVSEFMLQQTQVKTVLPYFARWLDALPSFSALATAPESKVIRLWEGLGYYSRARNLHRLAQVLAARPSTPRTPAEWQDLPGVGPYTAAAITSIALNQTSACVDGNVVRILARLTADATEFRDSASAAKTFTSLADALISPDHPGDHNQAMMELGATVCHRQGPLCTVCPVISFCAAARTGAPESFPRLAAKQREQVTVLRGWCLHEGKLLLHRAAAGSKRLAELHELPSSSDLGLEANALKCAPLLARKKRGITRYQITEWIYELALSKDAKKTLAVIPTLRWIPIQDLDTVTLSGPHRRWVTELLKKQDTGSK